ncbi:MAG: ribonuclease HII [Undibacterium sp.]
MQTPDFSREIIVMTTGCIPIGIDEAGRGPLAGPVVAAAVLYKSADFKIPEGREKEFNLIRDSKKLSEKQRETAFALVQEFFHVGVGIISAETIDRVNILQATFLAMKAALSSLERVANLRGKESSLVLLIDGNQELPNLSLKQETVVEGDGKVRSIAAASIIAKVTRDRLIILPPIIYTKIEKSMLFIIVSVLL